MSKAKFTPDQLKQAAALAAMKFIKPGMTVGLGTGSTANHFITALAAEVKKGLDVKCVPTSQATANLATQQGIPLITLDQQPYLDVVVDGADEIDPEFRLIKGGGGALLVEKIVASSARHMVVIADESKMVKTLGKFPLPVEVVPFGVKATAWKIERALKMVKMEAKMSLRMKDGKPFRTDAGNCILDCACGEIKGADRLEFILNNIPGVVNNGLFIGIAGVVMLAKSNGKVDELVRK